MWGKNKNQSNSTVKHNNSNRKNEVVTLVSNCTEINGDISFTGNLHIEGQVKGNIFSESGLLRLSESGIIQGEVRVPHVIINGKVIGDIFATERLELAAKAHIVGNVNYHIIEMAMGSTVNGSLEHSTDLAEHENIPRQLIDIKKTTHDQIEDAELTITANSRNDN